MSTALHTTPSTTASTTATTPVAAATGSPWQHTLDGRVTQVITTLLRTSSVNATAGWPAAAVLSVTAAALSSGLPGSSGRFPAARQQVACYAAVYGRLFHPGADWHVGDSGHPELLRLEHPSGQWLLDAPRAVHGDAPLVTDSARTLAADAGTDPLFAGVRLLALGAPLSSLLLTSSGELTALPNLHSFTHPTLALALASAV